MSQSNTARRIQILKYVVFAALGIILVRLFFIQIIEHNMWVGKAEKQHKGEITIMPKRGEIYMMDRGEPVPVVLNQSLYQITIDPTVTPKGNAEKVVKEYVSDYVVSGLDIDAEYEKPNSRYALLAKNIPRELADEVKKAELIGIFVSRVNNRVYPEGELASGLLGFVNDKGEGQYGIEGALNSVLTGKEGELKATFSADRVALSIGDDNVLVPAEDGKNVVLTIDRGLERGVEEIAAETINNTVADHASVLVMDSSTGEVLAMANLPNYDPDKFYEVTDASLYLNQVTDVPYEPASICKSFAFSAAINEGVMDAGTTYYNQGFEIVDGWRIQNAEQRASLLGPLTMKDALYWSLNTGSIYALKLLGGDSSAINQAGREKLYDYYYNKFKLGNRTGIELYDAEGFIPDPNEGWGRDSVYANLTFGQNLGITMIQTAAAWSAVINGGVWRTPTVIKGTIENGEFTFGAHEGAKEEQILKPETSLMMREMLINNRSFKLRNGIDRPGYDVGGKSGTAQVIRNGRYDDTMSETVGSYIGFVAPAGEVPKYVIMVKMWGEGQYLDGGMASNLFDSVSNYLIDYLKIKPGA